jgi:N-methylhydantoinase A
MHSLAQGVIDVVNSNMEQAVRLISVERGHDPRDFALVSFGGAGALHAADLARALGIPQVVVPRFPGALSALGLLLADARKDYSRSLLVPADDAEANIRSELEALHRSTSSVTDIATPASLSKSSTSGQQCWGEARSLA